MKKKKEEGGRPVDEHFVDDEVCFIQLHTGGYHGSRACVLGFRVSGIGFRVEGTGFRVQDSGCRGINPCKNMGA